MNVDRELFYALGLAQADEFRNWNEEKDLYGFYPTIKVIPIPEPDGIQGMFAREKDSTWDWEPIILKEPAIDLCFIELMDLIPSGFRDYQYVKSRITGCDVHGDLVGADLLIQTRKTHVFYKA